MKKEKIFNDLKYQVENFISENPDWVVIITWPTASGKTSISISLAEYFGNVEIIGADSRQVYQYMDIWTDKVDKQTRQQIKHHQIDIITPDKFYTVWQWKKSTSNIIKKIQERQNIPLVAGGTGLYISSIYKNFDIPEVPPDFVLREELKQKELKDPWCLHNELQNIDPKQAEKIHPNSYRYIIRALEIYYKLGKTKSELSQQKTPEFNILMVVLWPQKSFSNKLIKDRTSKMYELWLIQEVKDLLDMWYDENLQSMQWIGYKQTIEYLKWLVSLDDAVQSTIQATIKYDKRQRTWFRWYYKDCNISPQKNAQYLFYNNDF